ncbi:MAG: hypothetical protein WB779_11710 [Ignavibacteriaceae bacterium]
MLNKKVLSFLFLTLLLLNSCTEKKQDTNLVELKNSYNDPSFVLGQAKAILGNDVKQTFKGRFDRDTVIEVIAGTEVESKTEWGIRFNFLKLINGKLTKIWQTGLFRGSFKGSLCDKIKFPSFDHELVYYNSKDFYLGSSGGEVFTYIINFQDHKTYVAHLIDEGKPVSLYISDNIDVPEIHNFFFGIFKKDYPNLKIIDKDVQLKY